MAVKYERIVQEDLNIGTGTVDVTMPGGGVVVGHRIGPQSFTAVAAIASVNGGGQEVDPDEDPVVVEMDTEESNLQGWFDPDTSAFTPNVPGLYQVDGYLHMVAYEGVATITIFKNSAGVTANGVYRDGTSIAQMTVSALVYMNGTTDTLTLRVVQGDEEAREILAARMSVWVVGRLGT